MSQEGYRALFAGHIETMQTESHRLASQIKLLPSEDPCRMELEKIYQSLSNVLAVMKTDLNNIGMEEQTQTAP
jgi:hypothetical protein